MKEQAQGRNRRRFKSHLVNHELRLRLVLDDAFFSLFAALTAIGILYYLSNREIGDNIWSAHFSIKETRELLTKGVWVAGVVTFCAVLVFGIWSLLDAHRIAGPAHRLERLLNEIGEGNLAHEIQFRKRDEFQELAVAADTLVDSYRERIRRMQALGDSMESAVGKMPGQEDLTKLVAGLQEELRFFRLEAPSEVSA